MKIESRITDIAQEVLSKESQSNAASRQRSVTSVSDGNSTRKPIVSKTGVSNEQGKREARAVPVPIDVHKAIEMLNSIAEAQKKDVSFSVDEESESTVIKVFRTQTGELIRQFPSEEILAMRAKIRNNTGWFYDSKV
jgi:flagellar protein FlaG